MKTEVIKIRVSTEQKQKILELSKSSKSMTDWILEKLLPKTFIGSVDQSPFMGSPLRVDVKIPSVRKCIHPKCHKDGQERLVHGMKAWLCEDHA